MPIDTTKALADIRHALNHDTGRSGITAVDELVAVYRACIDRWSPPGSSYRSLADKVDLHPTTGISAPLSQMRRPLAALCRDYENGMVTTFEEMVHASVIGGLLEQAEHLHGGGYLLAAAVVAGAALESHLRTLAPKHGVTPTIGTKAKMASAMNDELHKTKAYSQPQWRQLQVWIDYRNDGAHGKPEFQNHSATDIEAMIAGVREFIVRYPA